MTAIAPIGTCRIHTPIRRAEKRYDFKAQRARNYGFTHTANEALQQLLFMRGELEFPAHVKPILFRNLANTKLLEQKFEEPDLYLVEVSSAKLLTVGETAIQMNYLSRHFSEFFAKATHARRFWQLSSSDDAAAKTEWLESLSTYRRLDEADQAILRSISHKQQSAEDVRDVMGQIVDIVGKDRLIFVTHVNALDPDARRIRSRDALITAVEKNAAAMGVRVYNPTELMVGYGQSQAMEKEGLDLTHFTTPFADQLFDDWNQQFFALGGDLAAQEREQFDFDGYHDLLSQNQVIEASRSLRVAARAYADNISIQRELARLEQQLGNYEAAIPLFEDVESKSSLADEDQISLMVSCFETGKAADALAVGERLLADEIETPQIIEIVARSSTQLGKLDYAVNLWEGLFYRGECMDMAASEVLGLLDEQQAPVAQRVAWANVVLERLPSHERSLGALWSQARDARDIDHAFSLIERSGGLSSAAAIDIADRCVESGWHTIATRLIAQLPQDDAVRRWINVHMTRWMEGGLQALDSGDLSTAAQLIQASWCLSPSWPAAAQARAQLVRQLRIEARGAYTNSDFERVLELVTIASSSDMDFPEKEAFAGRASLALGDYTGAIRHFRRATAGASPDIRLLQNLAQAALKAEQFAEAIDAHGRIIECPDASADSIAASLKTLSVIAGKAMKASRGKVEEGEYYAAHQLLLKARPFSATPERIDREINANIKALNKFIRSIDADDLDERFHAGKLLFSIDPQSEFAVRTAAVAAMQSRRFSDALELYQAMRSLTQNTEMVDRQISKCQLFLKRAA